MNIDLERLKSDLPGHRWFGDKSRAIERVELLDRGVLEDGDESLELLIVEVVFQDGGPSTLYSIPALISAEGTVREAVSDEARLKIVGEILASGTPVKGENGGIFHFSGPGLNPSAPPGLTSVAAVVAEQSNTSVVFDDEVILKFFRKVEVGPNPDLELTRLLTNEGFASIPPQLGEIFYQPEEVEVHMQPMPTDEEHEIDLGIAQRFIADSKEGWRYVLDGLAELYARIHPEDAPEDRSALIEERAADMLEAIDQLGQVTAEVHVQLSREDLETSLLAEPIEPEDLKAWSMGAIERLNGLVGRIPDLASLGPTLAERLRAITRIEDAGSKTRTHADYHLGQVLRVPRGWRILDFEGEPARSLEERRAKHSPIRDVAGMVRSFSYAAAASLFERAEPDSEEWRRLEPWAHAWEEMARDRLLAAYLATSHEGRFMPDDREDFSAMLDFFELDKALYEVGYERDHRPAWLRIPLRGIREVIERGEGS